MLLEDINSGTVDIVDSIVSLLKGCYPGGSKTTEKSLGSGYFPHLFQMLIPTCRDSGMTMLVVVFVFCPWV